MSETHIVHYIVLMMGMSLIQDNISNNFSENLSIFWTIANVDVNVGIGVHLEVYEILFSSSCSLGQSQIQRVFSQTLLQSLTLQTFYPDQTTTNKVLIGWMLLHNHFLITSLEKRFVRCYQRIQLMNKY